MNKKQQLQRKDRPNIGAQRVLGRIASYMDLMLTDSVRQRHGINREDSIEAQAAAMVRALSSGNRSTAANPSILSRSV